MKEVGSRYSVVALVFLLLMAFPLYANIILTDFKAIDTPNDAGGSISLSWKMVGTVDYYQLYRMEKGKNQWKLVGKIAGNNLKVTDKKDVKDGVKYKYKLTAIAGNQKSEITTTNFVISKAQWFNTQRLNILIFAIILTISISYFIYHAKRGKELFIRRIKGLDAVDEAIGRATEMGKPILFVPGIMDMDDIQTIAAVNILGQIAKTVAEYETPLSVPVSKSLVLSVAREVVKESYLNVGKPDSYNENSVFYLTDDQFGYVAGIDGIMVREKPAANFYLGSFYAESLILAETGFSTGAIQIAGTAQTSQLPFFIAACDYTLIGEELFAASAYLSKEPNLLGSLKGQDIGKIIVIVVILLGVVLELFNIHALKDFISAK